MRLPPLLRRPSPFALALALALQAAPPAEAQTPADPDIARFSAESALDNPQTPGVYRALSGMGVPARDFSYRGREDTWWTDDPTDVALLRHMFPDEELSSPTTFNSIDTGECRSEQPLDTLRARVAALGADSPYVKQWLRVQQAVFSACKSWQSPDAPRKQMTLPSPLATLDVRIERLQDQDRAYQSAAALFYEGKLPAAAQAFDRIARTVSPHRYYARYMAVAIRAGTQIRRFDYKPLVPVVRSFREAQQLVDDPHAGVVRRYAYDLIGWIGANNQGMAARRVQIRQALDALEQPLARIAADPEAERRYAAADSESGQLFTDSDEHFRSGDADAANPGDATRLWTDGVDARLTGTRAMIEAARTDPLAKWLLFPVSPYQASSNYGSGPAWLLADMPKGATQVRAALAKLAPAPSDSANPWAHEALMWSDRYRPELWRMVDAECAQARSGRDEAAMDRAALDSYHQTRTAIMFGGDAGFAAAAAVLAGADRKGTVWTSMLRDALRYLMSTGRIAEARQLRDRLGLTAMAHAEASSLVGAEASLRAANIVDLLLVLAEDEDHLVPLLTDTAYEQADLLSRLPIPALRRLAERSDVPGEDRSVFARMAWARTYALGRTVDPQLDRLMRSLNPDITAHWLSRPGRPIRPRDRLALQDVLATPALNVAIDRWARHRATPNATAEGIEVGRMDHNMNNGDNWWCPLAADRAAGADGALELTLGGIEPELYPADGIKPDSWKEARGTILRPLRSASFLLRSPEAGEEAALSRIPSAPQLLTSRAIAWVEHPGLLGRRTGLADTLAASIIATRWGCRTEAGNGTFSRAAFHLLHARFPDSEAAKRTKYWYN